MLSWTKRITILQIIFYSLSLIGQSTAQAGGGGDRTPVQELSDQKKQIEDRLRDNRSKKEENRKGRDKNRKCKNNPDAAGCEEFAPAKCDCWPGDACAIDDWKGRECAVYNSADLRDRFYLPAKETGSLLYFNQTNGRDENVVLEDAKKQWKSCYGNSAYGSSPNVVTIDYIYSSGLSRAFASVSGRCPKLCHGKNSGE
jgi:hypothetical protein